MPRKTQIGVGAYPQEAPVPVTLEREPRSESARRRNDAGNDLSLAFEPAGVFQLHELGGQHCLDLCERHSPVRTGDLEDVQQSVHVDVPGELRLLLGNARKQRRQMEDRVDAVLPHHGNQGRGIPNIQPTIGSGCDHFRVRLPAVAGRNDVLITVPVSQRRGQFGTDLPSRSRDENLFHSRTCGRSL